jgi:hypothetical protein
MTSLSLREIEAAIDTLQSSFSYDPPERWRSAYDALREVRSELRTARKPYAWLYLLGFALTIGAALTALGAFFAISPHNAAWLAIAALVLPIPEATSWLVTTLARRKHPALRYQANIESVCRPLDDLANDPQTVNAR